MNRNYWTGAASVLALLSAGSGLAHAADAPESSANEAAVDEVVVTGSRIQVSGFQQPTPVTVVGAQDVQKAMSTTIANYINQLPSFGSPTSSSNPNVGVSGSGLSLLNLRSLGAARTLVLLDNRRVVNSSVSSGVDTNTLPTTLIQRVEVVTGGASAAWGADAIAGVVNFVLNRNYEGTEVSIQGGSTDDRHNSNGKVDLTFGRKFLGGRASIVAAATYSWSPEIVRTSERSWWDYYAVVNNPLAATAGQPKRITVSNAAAVSTAAGTLIQSGAARGTQFLGPTGTPGPYDYGFVSTILQVGGTRELGTSAHRNLTNALVYGNYFAHARYDITADITAYVEGSYGRSVAKSDSIFYNRQTNITIRTDNPYLPTSVRDTLVAAGQTSATASRLNTEAGPPGSRNERELYRGVVGLDAKIGSWKAGVYYQHGEVDVLTKTYDNPLVPRYNLAIDTVRNPAGQIVCRSTLTNPGNGCVPYNIFGVGAASPEAVAYVFGTVPFQDIRLKADFVSAEASGPVFDLPAGPVTVAVGGDASREHAVSTQDADSAARNYATGNFQPFDGKVSFKEVFGEVNIPLLKDVPFAQQLEANAAGRMTDYSTSGTVYTWKLGLSDQVTDELRLRVTRSRDIRAPSLANLFTRGETGTQTVFDPLNNRPYTVLANTRGNPLLRPERADTWTAGMIYRPNWAPGLAASVDFYDIRIKGAIASLSSSETVNLCFGARPEVCNLIFRDASNAIIQIDLIPTNINLVSASGVDGEVAYRRELFNGAINLRALGSYQGKLNEVGTDGVVQHHAGAIAEEFQGQPHFKGQVTATYEQGPWTATAQYRFIGSAKLRNEWKEGIDVDDNHIGNTGYVDLRASYDFDVRGWETRLSVAVDNIFDLDPKIVPATANTVPYGGSSAVTRLDLYDALGRSFRVGLRAKF